MRVIVCGGRDFNDQRMMYDWLDSFHEDRRITLLVHGAASGADTAAARWAAINNVFHESYPADWKKHGRAAGPIRNTEMLATKPDAVIAFPGGRGTANMVRQARAAGVEVIEP